MKVTLLGILLISGLASAQWINYPTPGVPKNTDGLSNLNAPTPRGADGKPDFSGVWLLEKNQPCPKDGCPDMEITKEFMNIGWSLPGGLPYQPWALELRKERMAENSKGDPGANCRPTGIFKATINPFYRKFLMLPGLVVILNERDSAYRQIFTDGRALPVDPTPTPNGYSVGKWDGDTLVVNTIGISDGQWLDRNGDPLTDAAKLTERFRRLNYGTMEIEFTVDDAKAYTKPWTVKIKQFIALNTELIDFFCMENEKDAPHEVGK